MLAGKIDFLHRQFVLRPNSSNIRLYLQPIFDRHDIYFTCCRYHPHSPNGLSGLLP